MATDSLEIVPLSASVQVLFSVSCGISLKVSVKPNGHLCAVSTETLATVHSVDAVDGGVPWQIDNARSFKLC